MTIPRHARLELERRWVADVARLPDLANRPYRQIEDLYLEGRLRLRAITHSSTGAKEFRLRKKYERIDPLGGPVTVLNLTEAEYGALAGLPGARVRKRRYVIDGFNVDVFEGVLAGLALAEIETESRNEAEAAVAPSWAGREVSGDQKFLGWSLARATAPPT
jgi:hypothetical protein